MPGASVDNGRAMDDTDTTLDEMARRHTWGHFTRMSSVQRDGLPIIARGEGAWVWDDRGNRYLDALSGLFAVNAGHGRAELAEAAATARFPPGSTLYSLALLRALSTRQWTPSEAAELRLRKLALARYLLRSPCYDALTRWVL